MKSLWIVKCEIGWYFEDKRKKKMQGLYNNVVEKIKGFGDDVNLKQITDIRDSYIRNLIGENGEVDMRKFIGEEPTEESLLKKLMFGISEDEHYLDYCPNLFEIKNDRKSYYSDLNKVLPDKLKLDKKELEFVLSDYASDFFCSTGYDDKGKLRSYSGFPIIFDLVILLEMVDNKLIKEKPEVYRILCQLMKLENNMKRKTKFPYTVSQQGN